MAFLPVSTLDPVAAASIHSRASEYVKEQKKLGTLPPGLAEQLDAQLNTLGDPNIPDVEFVVFPGYMPLTSECLIILQKKRPLTETVKQSLRNQGRITYVFTS